MNEETPGLSVQVSKISINLWVYLQSHNSVIFKRDPQVSVLIHFSSPLTFFSLCGRSRTTLCFIHTTRFYFVFLHLHLCLFVTEPGCGKKQKLAEIHQALIRLISQCVSRVCLLHKNWTCTFKQMKSNFTLLSYVLPVMGHPDLCIMF